MFTSQPAIYYPLQYNAEVYATNIQKFVVRKIFNVFERSLLCLPKLHLYDQTVKITNIVKYYFNLL